MNKADSFLNDEIGPILEHPKKNNIKTEAGIPLKLVSDFDLINFLLIVLKLPNFFLRRLIS